MLKEALALKESILIAKAKNEKLETDVRELEKLNEVSALQILVISYEWTMKWVPCVCVCARTCVCVCVCVCVWGWVSVSVFLCQSMSA